jgi:hypothetical protein
VSIQSMEGGKLALSTLTWARQPGVLAEYDSQTPMTQVLTQALTQQILSSLSLPFGFSLQLSSRRISPPAVLQVTMNTVPEQNPGPGPPAGQEKPVTNEPIIEKIRKMDNEELLTWIQKERPRLLRGEDLENFEEAEIDGCVFLSLAGDWKALKEECNLSPDPSHGLANLASEVARKESIGIKSKSHPPCHARHADV